MSVSEDFLGGEKLGHEVEDDYEEFHDEEGKEDERNNEELEDDYAHDEFEDAGGEDSGLHLDHDEYAYDEDEGKVAGLYANDQDDIDKEIYAREISARAESAAIMAQRIKQRNRVKKRYLANRQREIRKTTRAAERRRRNWEKKLASSPFCVDLVAENERIDEENRIRIRMEERRKKKLRRRKEKVKNQILLKALAEASDLEQLRKEKRMIQEEERRLKALRDLEKTNGKRKQDLLAAQRAEKQRKQAQSKFLRKQRIRMQQLKEQKEVQLLREKLDMLDHQDEAFTEFSRTLGFDY
eukprot:g1385.t1